jgi:hypothetical protein
VQRRKIHQFAGIFKQVVLNPSPLHLATVINNSFFFSEPTLALSSYKVAAKKKKKRRHSDNVLEGCNRFHIHKLKRNGSATTTVDGEA